MQVKIVSAKSGQPLDIIGLGSIGTLTPYVNKKTGLDDPMVVYPGGRFLHVDTIRNNGGKLLNLDTGEAI